MKKNKKDKKDKKEKKKDGVTLGNFGRRKWDSEYFESKAILKNIDFDKFKEDIQKKKEEILPQSQRKPLEARKEDLDLKSQIGKKKVLTNTSEILNSKEQGGFYCKVCDITIINSQTFLDHNNSTKHLALMGMSNQAIKSSTSDIRLKLKQKASIKSQAISSIAKKLSELKKNKQVNEEESNTENEKQINENINKEEEEEELNEEEEKNIEEEENIEKEENVNNEEEMMKQMGIPINFGTTKKN
jgi:U4/U6.U5 tri-snRNP component SNU23